MISKQTILDRIEILRDGTMQIRFAIQVVEDGNVLANDWHRTALPPGTDLTAQMAAVNDHLVSMGKAAVDPAELTVLTAILPTVQTDAVVTAYQAKVAASVAKIG